jgi:hypothetical protein
MLARVLSAAVNGIEAFPVEVEVNSGWGDTVVAIVRFPPLSSRIVPMPIARQSPYAVRFFSPIY